jgi:hypothetical protein
MKKNLIQQSTRALILGFGLLIGFNASAGHESEGLPPGHNSPAPAGNTIVHHFQCSVPSKPDAGPIVGVGYSLECSTAALAPQYNVRGCTLISRVVAPNAKPKRTELKQVQQNASFAEFESGTIKVSLRKSDFSATIDFGDNMTSLCTILD